MSENVISNTNSPRLETATAGFINALAAQGGMPVYKLSVEEARGVLLSVQSGEVEKLPIEIDDRMISGAGGEEISIRILRPQNGMNTLPVVMYFHGGGWVLGNKHTHDRLIREIANGANAAVVLVNYTPSPEAKYPAQVKPHSGT
jgi:acetyl esterase